MIPVVSLVLFYIDLTEYREQSFAGLSKTDQAVITDL